MSLEAENKSPRTVRCYNNYRALSAWFTHDDLRLHGGGFGLAARGIRRTTRHRSRRTIRRVDEAIRHASGRAWQRFDAEQPGRAVVRSPPSACAASPRIRPQARNCPPTHRRLRNVARLQSENWPWRATLCTPGPPSRSLLLETGYVALTRPSIIENGTIRRAPITPIGIHAHRKSPAMRPHATNPSMPRARPDHVIHSLTGSLMTLAPDTWSGSGFSGAERCPLAIASS